MNDTTKRGVKKCALEIMKNAIGLKRATREREKMRSRSRDRRIERHPTDLVARLIAVLLARHDELKQGQLPRAWEFYAQYLATRYLLHQSRSLEHSRVQLT